jgi:hypothetical protein
MLTTPGAKKMPEIDGEPAYRPQSQSDDRKKQMQAVVHLIVHKHLLVPTPPTIGPNLVLFHSLLLSTKYATALDASS